MAEEERAGIDPVERALRVLIAQRPRDRVLDDVIRSGERGISIVIGVLVNGMIAIGSVGDRRLIAEEVDSAVESVIPAQRDTEGGSDEEWTTMREAVTSLRSNEVEEAIEEEDKLDSELSELTEVPLEELPPHLARHAIAREGHQALILKDAQVVAPSQAGIMRLHVLRIPIDQVAGWWPMRSDSFPWQPFGTEQNS
jgi:hypothetical protein